MTFLEKLYPGNAFLLGTLNILVQAAIIPLLALLVSRTLASRNAALRHCVLLTALLWIIASPLAAWRLNRAGLFTLRFPSTSNAVETPAKLKSPPLAFPAPISLVTSSSIDPSPSIAQTALPIQTPLPPQQKPTPSPTVNKLRASIGALMLIWIAISCALLLRLIRGLYLIFQIRRPSSLAAVPDPVRQQVCRDLAIQHLPPILISPRLSSPATIGIIHPAIVFPPALLDQITPDQLHDVLIHECVHHLRYDYAVGIIQRLVAAALWFHPMVHLLNRELCRAREEVCDNAVLAHRPPAQYSRTLLTLSQRIQFARTPTLLPGFFDRACPLEHRVAGLLNQRRIVMTRITQPARFTIFASVGIVGLTLSAVGISRAQSQTEQRSRSAPSTTMPASAPAPAGSPDDPLASLMHLDFVSPAEQTVRAEIETANRGIRRAQLSVQEAEIKLKMQEMNLHFKKEGAANHVVSDIEFQQAQLDSQMAAVQLDRARVGLEEAVALQPVRLIRLTAWDRQRQATNEYSVPGTAPYVAQFLSQHFSNRTPEKWHVQLLRKNRDGVRFVIGQTWDLPASVLSRKTLQAGDEIDLRRDIAAIINRSGKVLWEGSVQGKNIKLPDLLERAGWLKDPKDTTAITLRKADGRTPQLPPPATLGDVALGTGAGLVIEPGDTITLAQ